MLTATVVSVKLISYPLANGDESVDTRPVWSSLRRPMVRHPVVGSNMKKPSRKGQRGRFRLPLGGASRIETETSFLVLASAADLLMTYTLLWRGAHFYESNPVAQWFFQRWNIAGMTAYKFGMVAVIVVLSEIIERHRPGWGKAIVLLGTFAALVAVVHGLRLLVQHG